MARILILDGHSAAALAFTRSAGKSSHWVAVGARAGIFAAAQHSRYCNLDFSYASSLEDAPAFSATVLQFVRDQKIDLVIPVTDWTIHPLSEDRARFESLCQIALPASSSIELASDKYRTIEAAKSLGIRVPETYLIESTRDLKNLSLGSFPLVVKDRFSLRWRDGKAVAGAVSYAYSRSDLEAKVKERLHIAGDVLVQEFTAGVGVGFSCFSVNDDVRLPFQWKRVREVDPRGSASSCRESIALDERIQIASGELIKKIGFTGIAMVEYKEDATNQEPILMEINGRPWGSIALPIASGIDYPRYLINWKLRGDLPPKHVDYREGTTCRRLVGELTHLANVRAGKPANWPLSYPSFASTFWRMIVPWYPGLHYDDLWLTDPVPGVAGLKNWFQVRK